MKRLVLAGMMLATSFLGAKAEVDPNFHIYLCFGQSNMEGNAQWETIDNKYVDPRFQMLATTKFDNPKRTMGQWYTAFCPIVSPMGKLGMADYFGRTMVAAMPADVKIGVVAVAMGGSPIEMFDKDKYQSTIAANSKEWYVTLAKNYYGGNPYKRLIDMAKKAQEVGVIKGILLHQGESNNTQQDWPNKVKKIYNDILKDLGLEAKDVPLFAGETEYQDQGGACYGHNAVIARLPQVIPTAHVVSAKDVPGNGNDPWHFSASGYRIMGKRYAYETLKVMGMEPKADPEYNMPDNLRVFLEASRLNDVGDVQMNMGTKKTVSVKAVFADGHTEDVSEYVRLVVPEFMTADRNTLSAKEEGEGTVTVEYTDFTGKTRSTSFQVKSLDPAKNEVLVVNGGDAGKAIGDKLCRTALIEPLTQGKTYVVKAKIKADNSGTCALWLVWSDSPNKDNDGNSKDIQKQTGYKVTQTFKNFSWEFTAKYPHDKLQFAFGQLRGNVYFDDVTCVEKGTSKEMVANGHFDSDDLSMWEVIGAAPLTMVVEKEFASGIENVREDGFAKSNDIFDLQGRKVASPARGIYIQNGRKFVVK